MVFIRVERNFQGHYLVARSKRSYLIRWNVKLESCVQVKLSFDKRIPPKCPCCNHALPKNKKGQNVARDLPLLEAKVTFIIFPTIQGRCKSCDTFVTTRPKEIHPTKEATMRLMRSVSSWA